MAKKKGKKKAKKRRGSRDDPWIRIRNADERPLEPHGEEWRKTWQAALRKAFRDRKKLLEMVYTLPDLRHVPDWPDAILIKKLADYCHKGVRDGLAVEIPGLSRQAHFVHEQVRDALADLPTEKDLNLLQKFARTPEKVTRADYWRLEELVPVPPIVEAIFSLGDALAEARKCNHKRTIQKGLNGVDPEVISMDVDEVAESACRFLSPALGRLLIHPIAVQLLIATKRLAETAPPDFLMEWIGSHPFLACSLLSEEQAEKVVNALGYFPGPSKLEEFRKKVQRSSLDDLLLLLRQIRRWAHELPEEDEIVLRGSEIPAQSQLQVKRLLGQAYDRLVQELYRRPKGADPREKRECARVLEKLLLEDFPLLEEGFHRPRDLRAFWERAYLLGFSDIRSTLYVHGLFSSAKDAKRLSKVSPHFPSLAGLEKGTVPWLLTRVQVEHQWEIVRFVLSDEETPRPVKSEILDRLLGWIQNRLALSSLMGPGSMFRGLGELLEERHPVTELKLVRKQMKSLRQVAELEPVRVLLKCFSTNRITEEGYTRWLDYLEREGRFFYGGGIVESYFRLLKDSGPLSFFRDHSEKEHIHQEHALAILKIFTDRLERRILSMGDEDDSELWEFLDVLVEWADFFCDAPELILKIYNPLAKAYGDDPRRRELVERIFRILRNAVRSAEKARRTKKDRRRKP